MNKIQEKGFEVVKEFVTSELDEFGFFEYESTTFDESYDESTQIYTVKIKSVYGKETKDLEFKYDFDTDKIYIELNEDIYEEINTYDWRVKYFWMKLLKWEL